VNDSPVLIKEISAIQINEKQTYTIQVASNFIDIDPDDILSYQIKMQSTGVAPDFVKIHPQTGEIQILALNQYVGEHNLIVTATDIAGASAKANMKLIINNINDAPILIQSLPKAYVYQDQNLEISVKPYFNDIDKNDSLRYEFSLQNENTLPQWIGSNYKNGILTCTPQNKDVGVYNFNVIAIDLSGALVKEIFTIEVVNVNDVPVLENPMNDLFALAGQKFEFNTPENTFADIDPLDKLSYAVNLSDDKPLPFWLTFDGTNRIFTGLPLMINEYELKITATDLAGSSISDTVKLTISNVLNNNEINIEKAYLYPNPTKGRVVVNTGNLFDNKLINLKILNSSGQIIRTDDIHDAIFELDLSRYGSGNYILELNNNIISKQFHIIVE